MSTGREAALASTRERIFGLDLMRACAVIGVMYLHSGYLFGQKWPFGSEAATFGVESFFALSGFLVGSIALRTFLNGGTKDQIRYFLTRRWLRTLPAYYAFLILNLWLSHKHFEWRYLFFLQTMSGQEPLPYFNESWTLTVEEWFYLLLPAALLLIARFVPKRPLVMMIGFIIVSIAVRYILLGPLGMFWRDTYHITFLCLDAIMFGVIAAHLKQQNPGAWNKWKWPCLIVGLAILTIPFPAQPAAPWVNAILYQRYACGAALLLPALSSWKQGPSFVSAPIRWTALISYSLYLTHLPMASFLKTYGFISTHDAPLKIFTVWLVGTFTVATVSYFLIERTGMRVAEKLKRSGAGTTAG